MGSVVSAKQLNEALAQAKAVGLVEEKFKLGDVELAVRNLRPDEYESVVQECKDLEDLAYLNKWQEGHICRSIVEINGFDLRDTDFVEVEEPDPKNKQATRTMKRELHDWLRKNVLASWSKESIFTVFRKFTDVVQLAENKAKEGVTFVVADETAEEKYRRLLGEAKDLESEVPPHLVKAILEEYGYTFNTAPDTEAALRDLDARQKVDGGGGTSTPPAASEPTPAPQAPPTPATPATAAPATSQEPIERIANHMRQRVPMNQQAVAIPEMPKAPIVVPQPATSAPPPPPSSMTAAPPMRIPAEAANIDEAMRAAPPQAVLPPGMAPPPDAPPGMFANDKPTAPVLSQRGQHHSDPRGIATILDRPPSMGINPKFRPPR